MFFHFPNTSLKLFAIISGYLQKINDERNSLIDFLEELLLVMKVKSRFDEISLVCLFDAVISIGLMNSAGLTVNCSALSISLVICYTTANYAI